MIRLKIKKDNMPGKHSGFKMYGKSSMMKKLVGKQGKLDKNKDGEISKADFDMMNSKSPLEMYGKKSMAKMYGKKSAVKNYKKGYYGA